MRKRNSTSSAQWNTTLNVLQNIPDTLWQPIVPLCSSFRFPVAAILPSNADATFLAGQGHSNAFPARPPVITTNKNTQKKQNQNCNASVPRMYNPKNGCTTLKHQIGKTHRLFKMNVDTHHPCIVQFLQPLQHLFGLRETFHGGGQRIVGGQTKHVVVPIGIEGD